MSSNNNAIRFSQFQIVNFLFSCFLELSFSKFAVLFHASCNFDRKLGRFLPKG